MKISLECEPQSSSNQAKWFITVFHWKSNGLWQSFSRRGISTQNVSEMVV